MRGYPYWQESDLLFQCPPGTLRADYVAKAVKAAADDLDGLNASSPVYLQFLASEESAKDKTLVTSMGQMSSCALTVLALWRTLGVADPELWGAYKIGKAVAWLVSVARRHNVWRTSVSGLTEVRAGDVFLVASPEHAFICLEATELKDNAMYFMALHGGQRTSGGDALIQKKSTKLELYKGKLYYGSRSVVGVARTDLMTFTRTAKLPAGCGDLQPPEELKNA